MRFEVVAGTPGVSLGDVKQVLVPGRGRDEDGFGLTPDGAARVHMAAALRSGPLQDGRIVCSGYRSPVDDKGKPWSSPDAPGEVFRGRPEADAMRAELLQLGIPDACIRVERHSVDTVTNLLRSEHEGHFDDGGPVVIVAQRGHLLRILRIVAPRTLRRPYLGVVVPEREPMPESPAADMVSRLVSARLPPDPRRAVGIATRRAERIWRLAHALGKRSYH
jgi:hypothetical protein